ncbi:cytochrome P450 [Nocardia sp. NPDC050712]|uniref:cytochrome P450 n=1 Tax=Nocardia sp. NPDC050712 TaxID=3155518 RepID=UPI0033CA87F5
MSEPLLFNLWDKDFQQDPYPTFARLHAEAPVLRLEQPDVWLLTRHADVARALRTPTVYSSAQGVAYRPGAGGSSMVAADDPAHKRLRSILSKEFTPGTVKSLGARIDEVVHQLVAQVAATRADGGFDFATLFAEQMPTRVIGAYLGIDPERWADYRRWSEVFNSAAWVEEPDLEVLNTAIGEAVQCFGTAMLERRQHPRDDLISRMVTAMDEQGTLTEIEIIDFCSLLMLAGNATTSSVLNHAVLLLLAHPEQLAELRRDSSLIPAAVEEVIRFESPVQGFARRLTEDVELHGHTMRSGETVVMMFGAANRDPAVFDNPGTFDIHRNTRQHIGFGSGPHVCLGSWLARSELRSALAELIPLMSDWSIDADAVRRRLDLPAFRDLISVPVRWTT